MSIKTIEQLTSSNILESNSALDVLAKGSIDTHLTYQDANVDNIIDFYQQQNDIKLNSLKQLYSIA